MALEIERKFLVKDDRWRNQARGSMFMRQGYLVATEQVSVRVRLSGDRARITVKGATKGVRRREYEYKLPPGDAMEILDHLREKPLIEKTRYHVPHGSHVWEVDVFSGENAGLIVAEVELASENDPIDPPSWIGEEVSDDPRYYNACLVKHPFRLWKEQISG